MPLASEKRLGSDSYLLEESEDILLRGRDNVQVLRDGADVLPLIWAPIEPAEEVFVGRLMGHSI